MLAYNGIYMLSMQVMKRKVKLILYKDNTAWFQELLHPLPYSGISLAVTPYEERDPHNPYTHLIATYSIATKKDMKESENPVSLQIFNLCQDIVLTHMHVHRFICVVYSYSGINI